MLKPVGQLYTRRAVVSCPAGQTTVDDDVGRTGESDQPVPVGFVVGVEHRCSLVGVVQGKRDAHPVQGRQRVPGRIGRWCLDLDHIGTEVGEQSTDRVGRTFAQVKHPQGSQQRLIVGHDHAFLPPAPSLATAARE